MNEAINKVEIPKAYESINKDLFNIDVGNQKGKSYDSEDIQKIIEKLTKKFDKIRKIFKGDIQFEVDRSINMVIVKVIDKEKNEVIRQIPPEVVVKLAKAISEIEGILFDEKA